MPIASGAKGRASVLAMPSGGWTPRGAGVGGARPTVPMGSDTMYQRQGVGPFRSPSFNATNATITGVTRDSAGAALGGVTVQLFRTVDDVYIGETVSDGAGAYSIVSVVSGPFYIVAYQAGAPDVAGTTVNTLVPA